MSRIRRLVHGGGPLLALASFAAPGCGLAAGLLVGVITDAIDGSNNGDPTVLYVTNDAASLDAIVEIDVARADGAHVPYSYPVSTTPGGSAKLKNVFDAGAHWLRVVYASGWRSQARSIVIQKDDTVATTFLHGAPDLAGMAGTWFGSMNDSLGAPHTISFTLDAAGGAAARTIDGAVGAATGTLAETSEFVYRVTWAGPAGRSALVADAAHGHAGLVLDDGSVGALEKGAVAPLPPTVDADVRGTWTGTEIRLFGSALSPADLDWASATVSTSQHWLGTDGDGDGSSGLTPLSAPVPAFPHFEGDAESDASVPVPLALDVWLTADKTFGFVLLSPAAGGAFPDTGVFQLLAKSP